MWYVCIAQAMRTKLLPCASVVLGACRIMRCVHACRWWVGFVRGGGSSSSSGGGSSSSSGSSRSAFSAAPPRLLLSYVTVVIPCSELQLWAALMAEGRYVSDEQAEQEQSQDQVSEQEQGQELHQLPPKAPYACAWAWPLRWARVNSCCCSAYALSLLPATCCPAKVAMALAVAEAVAEAALRASCCSAALCTGAGPESGSRSRVTLRRG